MEVVSEPDMRSAQEAGAYLRKLSTLLRYIGTCTGSMEEVRWTCHTTHCVLIVITFILARARCAAT